VPTRVMHTIIVLTLVKNCSRNSSTLSKKYSVTSTNFFGPNQNYALSLDPVCHVFTALYSCIWVTDIR
jgi:hypothetical protein